MPTIIGHHNITKGAKHWLTSPKRKELFGPLGVTNIRTFVDPQNPNRVAVLMDVPDMDALMAAMQSKAATDAMASDGVACRSYLGDPHSNLKGNRVQLEIWERTIYCNRGSKCP